MATYIITINDREIDIDAINMQGYDREEAFEELNKVWKSYERIGRNYTYQLFEKVGNDWEQIFAHAQTN